MADHFCQFSCLLHVGSAENAQRAVDVRGEMAAELYRHEGCDPGFDLEISHEDGEGALWIHADEYGDPKHVIRFVQTCADAFNLTGLWGFTWAVSCSKPRIDAFGGGACLIDLTEREVIDWIDWANWLTARMTAKQAQAGQAPSRPNDKRRSGHDDPTPP